MNVEEMSNELNKSFTSTIIEDIDDMLGYSDVSPRVGDAYQADIPSLLNSLDLVSLSDDSRSFTCGLPIPIMYVGIEEATNCQVTVTNKYESLETPSNEKGNVNSKHESLFLRGDGCRDSSRLSDNLLGNCSPLPGSQLGPWNAIEQSLFILGLYIFGKNLGLVKRFVGTKTMGDVLCYYYGTFYRSTYYLKWSEGRKSKSKRWIHGIKIFTGWRLQELVSRLSCYLSEERQQMLIEGSRMVSEGKISMVEYVFTLKDWVGSDVVVEAISIGKGKRDLTATRMDPVKPTLSVRTHPDNIPFGKGFSSLSSSEILQVLTGDSRLSKARSSDLFFEAVWPRLLAKGWQSSQPRDSFSKLSVVYLPPFIKDFSQGLIKGDEYFDSISDILHKVVSEPQLLQLEDEAVNVKEVDMINSPKEQAEDKMLSKDQHGGDSMRFMVVDTSLVSEGAQTKVREFKSLPVGSNKFGYATSEINYSTNVTECVTKSTSSSEPAHSGTDLADVDLPRDSPRLFGNPGELRNIVSDEQSRVPLNVVATIPQELTLIACSERELQHDIGNISTTGGLESSKEISSRSSASSHVDVDAPKIDDDENSYPRIVIDLNIPHASLGSECEEEIFTNEMQNNGNLSPNRKCYISDIRNDPKASDILSFDKMIDEQPIENGRRQSTRSRPSAKALEAIAYGFLDAKKKRKTMPTGNSNSRRRVHAKSTDQTALNNVA